MAKKETDKDTFLLVLDLRNALAAAMRVVVEGGQNTIKRFFIEQTLAGVKDGIGKRADTWLKKHRRQLGNQPIRRKR